MDGIGTTHYPRAAFGQRDFLDLSPEIRKVPAGSVDGDAFVRAAPAYRDTEATAALRAYLEGDRPAQASPMERCVDRFLDGQLSKEELRAEYERLLKQELFGTMPDPAAPLSDWQKETATDFYSAFRRQILQAAAARNNAEGARYLTGEMDPQRSWSYYDSHWYYASEAAISAITAGAQSVAGEHGSSFTVPDYLAQGATDCYNFNTALRGDPFVAFDGRCVTDPDAVPPQGFRWFFEQGGDARSATVRMDSLTITDEGGGETVLRYADAAFDPTDPSRARTWVSCTDEDGTSHWLSARFRFCDAIRTVADLVSFSEKDTPGATLLNRFLANLPARPGRQPVFTPPAGPGLDRRV